MSRFTIQQHEANMKTVISLSKYYTGMELLGKIMEKLTVKRAMAYIYIKELRKVRYQNLRENIALNTVNQRDLIWNLIIKASKKLDEEMIKEDPDWSKIKEISGVVTSLNQEYTKASNLVKDMEEYLPHQLNVNLKRVEEIKKLAKDVGITEEVEEQIDADVDDAEVMAEGETLEDEKRRYNLAKSKLFRKKYYFDKSRSQIRYEPMEDDEEYNDKGEIVRIQEEIEREAMEDINYDDEDSLQEAVPGEPGSYDNEPVLTAEEALVEIDRRNAEEAINKINQTPSHKLRGLLEQDE